MRSGTRPIRPPRLAGGVLLALLAAGCGGGGGGETAGVSAPPAGGTVTVTGRITYARVPFVPLTPTTHGLDYAGTRQEPARGILVQALAASSQTVLASASTDDGGNYALQVPADTQVIVRAVAEMRRAAPEPLPHWHFQVRDEDAGSGPYTFAAPAAGTGSGGARIDLEIPSGWNAVTRRPSGPRHAAPFAVLDTVYRAVEKLRTVQPDIVFPPLTLDWSPGNRGGETFYVPAGLGGPLIVLAGEADVDTDEYDAHVIAHEFGHYVDDVLSRSDSIGGPHAPGDRLDMRVAFGEGFGYAFAAMVLDDPLVRDSFGLGQANDAHFDVEQDGSLNEGWYSEASNQEILWDLFDAVPDGIDSVALGLATIWAALTGAHRDTAALTSLFSFITALKEQNAAQAALIERLVDAEATTAAGMDIFGSTETNDAGSADVLPIYTPIEIGGGPRTVRSVADFDFGDTGNKLSSHRFLRLEVPDERRVRITVTALPGRDADVMVLRRGRVVASGEAFGDEDFTTVLQPGTYVLDVYDCDNAGCGSPAVAPGTSPITVAVEDAPS